MGNAKSVKLVLLILLGLTGVAHGAPGIYLRPVFEKSANGIFDQNKEVHFSFELNNRLKDPVEIKVVWQVMTDQKTSIGK